MGVRLYLLKKISKDKLNKDFDYYYDQVLEEANKRDYTGEIRIIKNKKTVNFYMIIELDQLDSPEHIQKDIDNQDH